jgi:hypothetical protein
MFLGEFISCIQLKLSNGNTELIGK